MPGSVKLEFFGRSADSHELDLYDAGRSVEGLGRTLSILGHFYETGKIIHQAPSSKIKLALRPPARGSFLIEVVAAAAGGFTANVAAVPLQTYLTSVMSKWLPGGSEADKARVVKLQRQLEIQGARIDSLEQALDRRDQTLDVQDQIAKLDQVLLEFQTEHAVMRSITANSFADIYRPVGRSADFAALYGDAPGAYTGVADAATVAMIQSDIADAELSEVVAVVKSFSTTSKVGIAFSNNLGRGFRFHYGQMGTLGKEDDFSWSQYRQSDILMHGRFYRFFDGSIKKLEVISVERIGSAPD